MAFDRDFLTMMPHTLTVEHWDGVSMDAQARPSNFGTSRGYRCRISGKAVAVRRPDNEQEAVIYDIWLWNDDEALFRQEDRITFPVSFMFRQERPSIFTVGSYTDEDSQHHVKLQCGWMYHRQGQ
jgi:hypothetical protein